MMSFLDDEISRAQALLEGPGHDSAAEFAESICVALFRRLAREYYGVGFRCPMNMLRPRLLNESAFESYQFDLFPGDLWTLFGVSDGAYGFNGFVDNLLPALSSLELVGFVDCGGGSGIPWSSVVARRTFAVTLTVGGVGPEIPQSSVDGGSQMRAYVVEVRDVATGVVGVYGGIFAVLHGLGIEAGVSPACMLWKVITVSFRRARRRLGVLGRDFGRRLRRDAVDGR